MIVRSHSNKLVEKIRGMKSDPSTHLRAAIEKDQKESHKEWMLWMMQTAAKKCKQYRLAIWAAK